MASKLSEKKDKEKSGQSLKCTVNTAILDKWHNPVKAEILRRTAIMETLNELRWIIPI